MLFCYTWSRVPRCITALMVAKQQVGVSRPAQITIAPVDCSHQAAVAGKRMPLVGQACVHEATEDGHKAEEEG
jgi:hypothetical protein